VQSSQKDFVQLWRSENNIREENYDAFSRITIQDLQRVFKNLPQALQKFLSKNVEKFIIVDDLGVSQFAHQISGTDKFLIFLDSKINSLGINDWYKHREYSALQKMKSDIVMVPYLSHKNLQSDTLQFVFSQSTALILSNDESLFPQNLESIKSFSEDSFISESWTIENGVISSKWQKYLSEIKFISFYGQSSRTINFDKVYEFYQLLDRTNFVNLYASSSPLRDFIESVAVYIHYKYLNKPFHIEFFESDVLLDSFSSCVVNDRCIGKRQKIDKILKSRLFPLVSN